MSKGNDPSSEKHLLKVQKTIADLADRYLKEHAEIHKKKLSIEGDKEDFIKAIELARKHAPEPSRVYARTRLKNTIDRYNIWNCFAIEDTLHFVGIQLVDVTSINSHDYERQKLLLEEFRFMLSHEIRQPLTNISGLVQLMLNHPISNNKEKRDLLKMIHTSVNKLDDAIKVLIKKAAREL